jgi:hypothetical protein
VNGHGGDKHSWYSYYAGILYARAGAAVLTYDQAGEAERNESRKSGTRTHDRLKGDSVLARHLAGLMITDVMQAVSYLASRPEVDEQRIGAAGYSLGSFVLALTGAVETRLKACVLVGGGNLDGIGGYWDSSSKTMCQALPYQSLRFLGDRGAVIYALHASCGQTLIYNGLADSVVGTNQNSKAFFMDLRQRTIRLYGKEKDVFNIGFIPNAGHRPYFITRPVALWLEQQLDLPNWTPESLAEMPTTHISEWAEKNHIFIDKLYDTQQREGGTEALADNIPSYKWEDLSILPPEQWPSHIHEYDFETWAAAARSAGQQEQPAGPKTGRIQIYPISLDYRSDGKVTGTVNGRPIRFSYFRNFPTYYYDTNYCRFAADGPVDIELTIHVDFKKAFLRGLLQDISFTRNGNTLRFTLPGPGNYYLQLPDLLSPVPGNQDSGTYTVAFWIDKLDNLTSHAMDLEAEDDINVTKAGIVSDPKRDQTDALQALLDKGGRLYFPAGIYRCGTLSVKSNTAIYLAPGAIIKAAVQRDTIQSRFFFLDGAENVRIYGSGTIDANYDGYPRDTANIHIVDIDRCRNITLEDLCFRNCNSWAVHLLRSDKIVCRNIRILSGKDGIDPDSSRDVLIENVFIQSKDDAVAVKTRRPPFTAERIVIRNSIVASDASALKIGTETRTLMRDITFENCDVFDSDRGLILYARDGGPIENVTWRNIRLFMVHWPDETGGTPLQFFITKREGATAVHNVLVEHINANMIVPCGFAGLEDAKLTGLKLHDITLRIDKPVVGDSYFRGNRDAFEPDLGENRISNRLELFKVGNFVDITIDGLTVNWEGNRPLWNGIASEASGLKIRNFREIE